MKPIKQGSSLPPGPPGRSWLHVGRLFLVAITYWIAVRLGLLVVAQPEGIASIWPASGLALALLLLNPRCQWPSLLGVIFMANAAGNLSAGNPLWVSLGFALANILEPFLCAWVLTSICRARITFTAIPEIFALFGVALIVNAFTALIGAAVPAIAISAPFWDTWRLWWASDGLGILLVTPLIVTWFASRDTIRSLYPRRLPEAVILLVGLVVFAGLLFGPFTVAGAQVLRIYMLFPLIIWLAFRFHLREMATAITLLASIAIWNTLQGFGIFAIAEQSVSEHLISLQIFLGVTSVSGLLLSSLVAGRNQAGQALRQSEDKYKYVFDHSVVGKSFTKPSGEINVNQAFCAMLGYSEDELKSRTWQEISHPEDLELTQNTINSLLTGEKDTARFVKRYLHKNGSIVWTDLGTTLRRDEDGKPLYFLTTVLDITERILAEQALQVAKDYAENLIETANTMVVGLDTRGTITVFNKAAEAITGYTRVELQGRNWFEVIAPRGRYPQVWAEFEKMSSGGLPRDFENPILTRSGEERFIVWQNSEVYEKGDLVGTISFGMDITARRQAEEQIRQLNTSLEQRVEERTHQLHQAQEQLVRQEKLAVLGQMAGSVGHELRNPLGVINNAIYYLKLIQPDAGEKIKQHHDMIEQEVRTADKIISDLLDFARIKSVERKPDSVLELIQNVLARFPVPASVKTTLKIPADLPEVLVDPRQMEQVLGNLVTNACQAMPEGGKLTISAKPQEGFVLIAVKDTGTGITPENMLRLFEPLFTTKAKGIGLGLAVSLKLTEANGGRLEVESEPGRGSTFTLVLPVGSSVETRRSGEV
jgi:PAS domain S-box-containing protein